MMDANILISLLTPEINKKCYELKLLKKEKKMNRIFIVLCIGMLVIPTMLVIFNCSLLPLLITAGIVSLSLLLLVPVMMNQSKGGQHDQVRRNIVEVGL
jgi:hypothetical protein